MAKKQTFVAKNLLLRRTYVYVVATFAVLFVLFCALGNVGVILSVLNLGESQEIESRTQTILEDEASTQQASIDEATQKLTSEEGSSILLYGEGDVAELFAAQLFMSKHAYIDADSLDDVSSDVKIVMVSKEQLSASEIETLTQLVESGVTLMLGQIPDDVQTNEALQELLGIEDVYGWEDFTGLRTSEDFMDGVLIEDETRELSAWNLSLKQQTKIYACTLPDGYKDKDNEDLPAVAWRYVSGSGCGSVYVCNGDFMDSEVAYAIIPLVMRESQGSYLYPIVNAYCTFIDGFPYIDNEDNEAWERLYSRDRLGIQQDMLMPEFERFASVYGATLTYFSDDYERLLSATSNDITYYTREIDSQGAQLALRKDGNLYFTSVGDKVEITPWVAPYRLWDEENQCYELPVNCVVKTSNYNTLPDLFCLASITGALGYYCVSVDVDDFLDYDGTDAFWAQYTEQIEVLFGTHQRDYSWIERVTANDALNRINKLLNLDVDIEYTDTEITADIANFDGEAWFMLRTGYEDLHIEGGTLEQIGEGVYFITATQEHVSLTWSDGL